MRYVRATDITEYLFCPRKVYLKRVLGLEEEKKEVMIKGSIIHDVFDKLNENEEKIVYKIIDNVPFDTILRIYEEHVNQFIHETIEKYKEDIENFKLELHELFSEVKSHIWDDIIERAKNVHRTMTTFNEYGIFLWDKLEPKIKSEVELISDKYQLVGRVDKLEIYKTIAIPVEIKSGRYNRDHNLQLHTYYLLLRENFPKYEIPYGIIQYTKLKKKKEVKFSEKKINFVLRIRDKILEIIEDEKEPPRLDNYKKCRKCAFFDICWKGIKPENTKN